MMFLALNIGALIAGAFYFGVTLGKRMQSSSRRSRQAGFARGTLEIDAPLLHNK